MADIPATLTRCMSRREAARFMGVSTAKIDGWIRRGELVASNVSGSPARPQWRISPERRSKQPAGYVERY